MKALGMQKPGINPSVLLGLVTPVLDPQLTAVLWTFRSLRVHCPVDFWLSSVSPVAHGDLDLPPNSLASIALQRSQSVCFRVSRLGTLVDQFGAFCPMSCNVAELDVRVQLAWRSAVVAQKVVHKDEIAGLSLVDVATTRRTLNSLGKEDQAMYRLGLACRRVVYRQVQIKMGSTVRSLLVVRGS